MWNFDYAGPVKTKWGAELNFPTASVNPSIDERCIYAVTLITDGVSMSIMYHAFLQFAECNPFSLIVAMLCYVWAENL